MALWGVRAGSHGENEQYALDNKVVVIGWGEAGDLSAAENREKVLAIVNKTWPNEPEPRRKIWSAEIHAFRNRIRPGDLVALPLHFVHAIAFGEVQSGGYRYAPQAPDEATHQLPVKWIKTDVPRVQIPKDLRNSLGSALTVFQVSKNDAENRIRALLQGKVVAPVAEDDDVAAEAPERLRISSLAENQIVEFIGNRFKEHNLARLVEGVLQAQGYQTELSPPGPDGGVDILAGAGPLGFGGPSIAVQVKSGAGPSGSAELNQLKGAMSMFGAPHGLFVSWNGFTSSALKTARQNYFSIRLWDAEDLIEAIQLNFSALPAQLKAELPLQQIWALVDDSE